MNKLELCGKTIGNIIVLNRGPNTDGAYKRSQHYIKCKLCEGSDLVVTRDLKRYSQRFKKGCYTCSKLMRKPKSRFRYGRTVNGFVDKSVIIEN